MAHAGSDVGSRDGSCSKGARHLASIVWKGWVMKREQSGGGRVRGLWLGLEDV